MRVLVQTIVYLICTVLLNGCMHKQDKFQDALYRHRQLQDIETAGILKAISRMDGAINSLQEKGASVSDLRISLDCLKEDYRVSPLVTSSDLYRQSLEDMTDSLTQAIDVVPTATKTILTDVNENLNVMCHGMRRLREPLLITTQVRGHSFRNTYFIGDVAIEVRTTNKGHQESGWQIFFMEYFYHSIRKQIGPGSFPSLSSPTSYLLPPGRYIFEARKGTEEKGICTVVTLDDRVQTLEIPVTANAGGQTCF